MGRTGAYQPFTILVLRTYLAVERLRLALLQPRMAGYPAVDGTGTAGYCTPDGAKASCSGDSTCPKRGELEK